MTQGIDTLTREFRSWGACTGALFLVFVLALIVGVVLLTSLGNGCGRSAATGGDLAERADPR
jgi:hypothetical protein